MKVKLLAYTPNPLNIIQTACKTCYSSDSPIDLMTLAAVDKNLINQVFKSGHLSTFEHINFTFAIEEISRACANQLVRHRHCSFSQQSQRYVKFTNPIFYEPDAILKNREADAIYNDFLDVAKETYQKLIALGIKAEDARCVLPNSTCSNITLTLNLRELIHICSLRLCSRSQKEIRTLVQEMVNEVVKVEPWLKTYLVPQCEKDGFCKEHKSCGRKKKLEEINENEN